MKPILTHVIDYEVKNSQQTRGVRFRYPINYKKNQKNMKLAYKVNFNKIDGKLAPHKSKTEKGIFSVYSTNPSGYLKQGVHKFLNQVEISGYDFQSSNQKDNKKKSFYWRLTGLNSMPIEKVRALVHIPKIIHPDLVSAKAFIVTHDGPEDLEVLRKDRTLIIEAEDIQAYQQMYLQMEW